MFITKVLTWALFTVNIRNATCFQSSLLPGQCSRTSFSSNGILANGSSTTKTRQYLPFGHIQHRPKSFRNFSWMAGNDGLEDEDSIMKSYARRGLSPKITKVQKTDDFLGFIAEDERLCVVKFYASWCKSCHKFGIRYKKLATKHADKTDKAGKIREHGPVRFAEVEYGQNTSLCRALGIRKLPYVIIYKASVGKIAEFPCGPKYFDERLVGRLNQYLEMSDEELQFEQKMEGGTVLGNDILSQLQVDDAAQPSI